MSTKNNLLSFLAARVTSQEAQLAILQERYADATSYLAKNRDISKAAWKEIVRNHSDGGYGSLFVAMLEANRFLDDEQILYALQYGSTSDIHRLFRCGMRCISEELGNDLIAKGVVTTTLAREWLRGDNDKGKIWIPKYMLGPVYTVVGGSKMVQNMKFSSIFPVSLVLRGLTMYSEDEVSFRDKHQVLLRRPDVCESALFAGVTSGDVSLLAAVAAANPPFGEPEFRKLLGFAKDFFSNDVGHDVLSWTGNRDGSQILCSLYLNPEVSDEIADEALQLLQDLNPERNIDLRRGALKRRPQAKARFRNIVADLPKVHVSVWDREPKGYADLNKIKVWQLAGRGVNSQGEVLLTQHQLVNQIQPLLDRHGVSGWSTFFAFADDWDHEGSLADLLNLVLSTLER